STGAILLFGCQANNPYQAQGLPLPAAPAAAATHFDKSAYPAVTDKKIYTYWCWNELSTQSLYSDATQSVERQALAEQLEQYAFRPASSSNRCELKITINSQYGQQTRRDYSNYPSAHYGYGYGRSHGYHDRYRYSGIGMDFPIIPRTYTEHFQQLTLTFTDAESGQTIWQTQSQITSNQHAQTSETALREAINKMLKDYQ
ncbi:MAG TPA: hypothetical protein DCF43_11800, partial [Pseudomonas sp.]|nr:hypothetical protein [Pseudomonas sp.]